MKTYLHSVFGRYFLPTMLLCACLQCITNEAMAEGWAYTAISISFGTYQAANEYRDNPDFAKRIDGFFEPAIGFSLNNTPITLSKENSLNGKKVLIIKHATGRSSLKITFKEPDRWTKPDPYQYNGAKELNVIGWHVYKDEIEEMRYYLTENQVMWFQLQVSLYSAIPGGTLLQGAVFSFATKSITIDHYDNFMRNSDILSKDEIKVLLQ